MVFKHQLLAISLNFSKHEELFQKFFLIGIGANRCFHNLFSMVFKHQLLAISLNFSKTREAVSKNFFLLLSELTNAFTTSFPKNFLSKFGRTSLLAIHNPLETVLQFIILSFFEIQIIVWVSLILLSHHYLRLILLETKEIQMSSRRFWMIDIRVDRH